METILGFKKKKVVLTNDALWWGSETWQKCVSIALAMCGHFRKPAPSSLMVAASLSWSKAAKSATTGTYKIVSKHLKKRNFSRKIKDVSLPPPAVGL